MAKELSVNKNTIEFYESYKNQLINPISTKGMNILVFELCNKKYIDEIKSFAKNVCVIDSFYNKWFDDDNVFVDINTLVIQIKSFLEKNNMAKFDLTIMNPPYGSLFLKVFNAILETKCSDEIICIGPYQWIIEPWKKDNLNKILNNQVKIIKDYNYGVIDFNSCDLAEIFKIGEERPGGILHLKFNEKDIINLNNFHEKINKETQKNFSLFKNLDNIKKHLSKYDGQKYFVPIRTTANMERWWCYRLINYLDIIVNGKVYSGDYAGKTIIEAREANPHETGRTNDRDTFGIVCSTKQEAINLRDLLNSPIMLYIISLVKFARANPLEFIPYFDCKNGIPSFKTISKKCNISLTQKEINKLMKDR